MSSQPGILYVTMQPKPSLSIDKFHEWYNNEHGPTRLRIPEIFANGLRYRAADGQQPEYLASYDVKHMPLLDTETYLKLRANRSPREAAVVDQVDIERYLWDLLYTKEAPNWTPLEGLSDQEAAGKVTVSIIIELSDAPEAEQQCRKWFEEEHAEMSLKVPGFLRARLLKTSPLQQSNKIALLTLVDLDKENGVGGEAHQAALNTPWQKEIMDKYVVSATMRPYSLFHVFGPAPTDLASLAKVTASDAFTATEPKLTTTPGSKPAIESFVTMSDGLIMPYRLEGNADPNAPTVAFVNSLLTSLHMWDPFIEILKKDRPDLRLLRYDTRGRNAIPQPPVAATMNQVTDDTRDLLDALRITKLYALIGVSMGGGTTTNFAIKYPSRLDKFIACDFPAASSEANTQAWKDRIAIAEENNGQGIKKLATLTVARWFHDDSMKNEKLVRWMEEMVAANDVVGFKHGCTALCDFDLKPQLSACKVPGLMVAGETDANGMLPKMMDGFKGLLGDDGCELKIVPGTGHLPMCENPEAFWNKIRSFL